MTALPALRPIIRVLSSFLVVLVTAGPAQSQTSELPATSPAAEALSLAPGASLEREIRGGETRTFELPLKEGTFLFLEILSRSARLSFRLVSCSGETLSEAVGSGSQLLAAFADRAGICRLEAVVPEEQRISTKFGVRVLALRPAGSGDEGRIRGARTLAAARRLLVLSEEEPKHRAETLLTESLAAWQEAGDSRGEAEVLLVSADLWSEQGSIPKALVQWEKALERSNESAYAEGEARALEGMGFCNSQLAHHDEAITLYLRALEILQREDLPFEQASMLVGLGIAYQKKQDFQAALEAFEKAQPLAEASGDLALKARVLTGVGAGHFLQYRLAKAQGLWEEALKLSRLAGDQQLEADLEQNLAAVYHNQGLFQKALDLFTRAVARTSDKESGMARYNMGNLFLELGDPQKALENYQLSQQAFHAKGNAEYEANALIGIGWTLQRMADPQSAIAEYEKARRLLPAESWSVAYSIGRAQVELRKPEQALPSLQRALEMAKGNSDRSREGATLLALGSAYSELGQLDQAMESLKEAIAVGREIGHQSVVALALLKRSQISRDQGRLEEALADVENAIVVIESTRRNIAGDQLRAGFFAAKRTYYDLYIDLLLQLDKLQSGKGYLARALEATERARARGLLDLLAEGRIDIHQGLDQDLRQREDDLSDRISRLQRELRAGNARPDRLQELRTERDALDKRREQLEVEIQTRNKRYAEVRYPVPLKLEQIQLQVLDDRTALLEYVLGEKGSTLFVITREGIKTYTLPASEDVEKQVMRLRKALEQVNYLKRRDYLESAFELYRNLVEPASAALAGKSNLLIVPDGALYYIPFEALLTAPGDRPYRDLPYLLRLYSIAYIPSASVLAGLREARQESLPADRRQVAAFAPFASPGSDAVTRGDVSRPSANSAAGAFKPLPGSGREIEEIARLYPGAALRFVGSEADEAAVTSNPAVATARRLHFATHAQIDERHPEYSALVLAERPGEDGLLQMREIFNLKLSADLAVLSACQTALGKEVNGEGLMGLTRAFFFAGVPSLVVSLWNVVDGPTPDLMLDFYRNFDIQQNKSKALQTSKLSMIARGTYSDPSYWAPFILLGEPR